jgi:hypothetical protein
MYRIQVPAKSNEGKRWLKWQDEDFPKNRPHAFYNGIGSGIVVAKDNIHIWLEDFNIKYHLEKITASPYNKWFFVFEKESDALLFKLTWGGDV